MTGCGDSSCFFREPPAKEPRDQRCKCFLMLPRRERDIMIRLWNAAMATEAPHV